MHPVFWCNECNTPYDLDELAVEQDGSGGYIAYCECTEQWTRMTTEGHAEACDDKDCPLDQLPFVRPNLYENGDQYAEINVPDGHWLRWYDQHHDPRCLCAACAKTAMVSGDVEFETLPVTATANDAADEIAVFCESCFAPLART